MRWACEGRESCAKDECKITGRGAGEGSSHVWRGDQPGQSPHGGRKQDELQEQEEACTGGMQTMKGSVVCNGTGGGQGSPTQALVVIIETLDICLGAQKATEELKAEVIPVALRREWRLEASLSVRSPAGETA